LVSGNIMGMRAQVCNPPPQWSHSLGIPGMHPSESIAGFPHGLVLRDMRCALETGTSTVRVFGEPTYTCMAPWLVRGAPSSTWRGDLGRTDQVWVDMNRARLQLGDTRLLLHPLRDSHNSPAGSPLIAGTTKSPLIPTDFGTK
jgi:hypothetical protein